MNKLILAILLTISTVPAFANAYTVDRAYNIDLDYRTPPHFQDENPLGAFDPEPTWHVAGGRAGSAVPSKLFPSDEEDEEWAEPAWFVRTKDGFDLLPMTLVPRSLIRKFLRIPDSTPKKTPSAGIISPVSTQELSGVNR